MSVIGCGTLAFACAGADFENATEESESLGTLEQPLCEDKGGTNSVMTAIAVAAGRELRRWKPETDFKWNTSTGRLELTPAGTARCGSTTTTSGSTSCVDTWNPVNSTCAEQKSWGNCSASWMGTQCQATCGQCSGGTTTTTTSTGCRNTQALLDMQKPEAHGKVTFPGNIMLDATLLRQQLKAGWDAQMSCNSSGSCAAPDHDLKYTHVESGSCDKKFFYDPLRAGSSTWLSATDADKLKNKLKFVGYPTNKMLNFYVRDGQVSVDPTYGLNEGVTSTAGSCDVACTKFSTSDLTGKCCSCNGVSKKYVRSAFNSTVYLCAG